MMIAMEVTRNKVWTEVWRWDAAEKNPCLSDEVNSSGSKSESWRLMKMEKKFVENKLNCLDTNLFDKFHV